MSHPVCYLGNRRNTKITRKEEKSVNKKVKKALFKKENKEDKIMNCYGTGHEATHIALCVFASWTNAKHLFSADVLESSPRHSILSVFQSLPFWPGCGDVMLFKGGYLIVAAVAQSHTLCWVQHGCYCKHSRPDWRWDSHNVHVQLMESVTKGSEGTKFSGSVQKGWSHLSGAQKVAFVAYGLVRVRFVHSRKAVFFWKGQFYRSWVSISSGLVGKRSAFKCDVSPFRVTYFCDAGHFQVRTREVATPLHYENNENNNNNKNDLTINPRGSIQQREG